jgi:hypothetical protein
MRSPPLSRRQLALGISWFTAVIAFALSGCRQVHYVYPKNLQGFALPQGCPPAGPPTRPAELSACLTGIDFDTAQFVGDEQRLMVRELSPTGPRCHGETTHSCRYGPLAKVEPVKGAELYDDASLKQGRIIARIFLRKGETESYSKFDLAPGDTTYWWVSTAGDGTSAFVRRGDGRSDLPTKKKGLKRDPHPPGSFQQAVIRWVWDPEDETLNGGCGGSCCKPR